MTRRAVAIAAGLALLVPAVRPAVVRGQGASIVLARAGMYLAEYERTLAVVVSEEKCTQSLTRTVGAISSVRQRRTTRSDVIFTNVAENSWVAFRDVFEVDDKPVRDRDQRLQRLFVEQPAQAMVQARRIMDESARYNLGSLRRNINIPTMALTYLKTANQPRSTFTVTGRDKVDGVEVSVLSFKETASPTVIRADARDMPATGKFWVDPDTGRVLKSELDVLSKTSRSKITVTYAPAPKLTIWTPVTMKEEYTTSSREVINAEAKYSNFRQFNVSTAEDLTAPEYVKIGNAQLGNKDYKGAETAFRRATELDPNLADAHAALGRLLATTNRKSEAISTWWKRAVDLDPQQFDTLFTLTRALAEASRKDEARTYGERFIATAPADTYKQNIAIIRKLLDGIRS